MKKKLAALLVVAAIVAGAAYAVTSGRFNWQLFLSSLRKVNPWWMAASIVVTFATYGIRACRWQVLLEPVQHIRLRRLLETTLLGFSGIYILGRAGELVRPVWVSRREGVPFSAAVATLVAERFLDSLSLIGMFVWAMMFVEIPDESAATFLKMKSGAWYLLAFSIFALLALFVLRSNLPRFSGWIPFVRLRTLIQNFVGGLAFLDRGVSFGLALGYSVLLWISIAAQFWLMLRGMHFDLSLPAASLVLVGAAIGSIAQIPGIGGGFQAAFAFCLVTFFLVPTERAIAAGFIAWVASYGPTILVTALYMALTGVKLSELKSVVSRKPDNPEPHETKTSENPERDIPSSPASRMGNAAFDVLGIPTSASQDEIKAAYYRMAQQYHPDKVATLAPEFRELAEQRMKEINAAYEELQGFQ